MASVYWLFCGSPWQDELGYNEAREQHFAELAAHNMPKEFQLPKDWRDSDAGAYELMFRLVSLASWIEAHESLLAWRSIRRNRAAWDGEDREARQQARDAGILASLPCTVERFSDWAIADFVKNFTRYDSKQWRSVLKKAAVLTEVPSSVKEVDNWIWWRFPIFSRCGWSAAEALSAAQEKFPDHPDLKEEGAFKSHWVRRGLRFSGRRTSRRQPPLAAFVTSVPVPKTIPDELSLLY